MKIKIEEIKVKEFKPIDITFTIETVQEARLMYHLLNIAKNPGIYETLKMGGYSFRSKSNDVSPTLLGNCGLGAFEKISDLITSQGYDI